MSIRTILEVNHDYVHDLLKPENAAKLLEAIRGGFMVRHMDGNELIAPGVKFLAQRHHSETLKLTIK